MPRRHSTPRQCRRILLNPRSLLSSEYSAVVSTAVVSPASTSWQNTAHSAHQNKRSVGSYRSDPAFAGHWWVLAAEVHSDACQSRYVLMRLKASKLQKCSTPSTSKTKPILSLNSSIRARPVLTSCWVRKVKSIQPTFSR